MERILSFFLIQNLGQVYATEFLIWDSIQATTILKLEVGLILVA